MRFFIGLFSGIWVLAWLALILCIRLAIFAVPVLIILWLLGLI